MKRILITGGFGIVGTSLSKTLYEKGFKIFILDRSRRKRNLNSLSKSKIKRIYGNFNNLNQLINIIKKNKFNTVIHLGAITQALDSYLNPLDTFKTNITGTINILEAIRRVDKKINVIFSSSAKAYGKMKKKPFVETDTLHGDYPDDVSKSAADLISQSYSKTYDLKIGIIRSSNIYGPADNNMGRLIPGVIVKALKGQSVELRASSKFKRDYIFVDDASKAYYKLILYMNKNKKKKLFIYNLGSKFNLNNLEVIKRIYKIMKVDLKPIILNQSSMENVAQKIDFSKATKDLEWIPNTSFKEGILKTIKWYKNYYQI
tara:strand:- start:92 stop:1042 length:951 start_codon:yes stop_codon:yes gene_type:complete